MIGPPWAEPATAWSIEGSRINVRLPSTHLLVRALLSDEDPSGFVLCSQLCASEEDFEVLADHALPVGSPLTFEVLNRVADRLIENLMGVTRWRATRLWAQAVGNWAELEGECLTTGVDLLSLPAREATNLVYAILRKWVDPENRQKWIRELDKEPLREVRRLIEEEVPDETPGMFEQMMELDRQRKRGRSAPPEDRGAEIVMPE